MGQACWDKNPKSNGDQIMVELSLRGSTKALTIPPPISLPCDTFTYNSVRPPARTTILLAPNKTRLCAILCANTPLPSSSLSPAPDNLPANQSKLLQTDAATLMPDNTN